MKEIDYIHERNRILIMICWACLLVTALVCLPNAPERIYFNELLTVIIIAAAFFGIITYMIIKKVYINLSMYGIILCGAFICFFLTFTNPINMNYILFFSLLGVSMYYNSYKPLILTFIILIFATNYFFFKANSVIFVVLPPYNTVSSLVAYNFVIMVICTVFAGQMYVGKKMYHNLQVANEILNKAKIELSTDALTGVYNYKYFEYLVNEKLNKKEPFTFIMIDMDKFKEINDGFGHMAGNSVLQEMSDFLRKTIYADDMIFRFGGDEFCIIIRELERCKATVEAILSDRKNLFSIYQGKKIEINFSAGIYKYNGKEEIDFQKIVDKADKVMYEAKKQGGNRIFQYEY